MAYDTAKAATTKAKQELTTLQAKEKEAETAYNNEKAKGGATKESIAAAKKAYDDAKEATGKKKTSVDEATKAEASAKTASDTAKSDLESKKAEEAIANTVVADKEKVAKAASEEKAKADKVVVEKKAKEDKKKAEEKKALEAAKIVFPVAPAATGSAKKPSLGPNWNCTYTDKASKFSWDLMKLKKK